MESDIRHSEFVQRERVVRHIVPNLKLTLYFFFLHQLSWTYIVSVDQSAEMNSTYKREH